mmetsp:Transcript_70860/g.194361  ORF Transcript_70860/g.194361 Transcript_70860/m.194361 type:complete len:267 (+) Transcript_70860:765-1565(+)
MRWREAIADESLVEVDILDSPDGAVVVPSAQLLQVEEVTLVHVRPIERGPQVVVVPRVSEALEAEERKMLQFGEFWVLQITERFPHGLVALAAPRVAAGWNGATEEVLRVVHQSDAHPVLHVVVNHEAKAVLCWADGFCQPLQEEAVHADAKLIRPARHDQEGVLWPVDHVPLRLLALHADYLHVALTRSRDVHHGARKIEERVRCAAGGWRQDGEAELVIARLEVRQAPPEAIRRVVHPTREADGGNMQLRDVASNCSQRGEHLL